MASFNIAVNALAESADVQMLQFVKRPGEPIEFTVVIGTDRGPPNDKIVCGPYLLSAVSSGPSAASLKACRDHAVSQKFPNP